jgi:plastocyanin
MLNQIKKMSFFVLLLTTLAHAESHTIKMKSLSYDPKTIEIKAGDSVQWENQAYTEHSATSIEKKDQAFTFDTGLIQPQKKSKNIIFKTPGTYAYHCSVHGPMMNATITVTP